MPRAYLQELFSLEGKVAIVTGGTGVLGGAMARGLARAGAAVGVLGRRRERAEEVARDIADAGGEALALPADVLQRGELESARDSVLQRWNRIDILVNAAGGHVPEAIVGEGDRFFDLPQDAFRQVVDLNLLGTVLPSQVFGEAMAGQLPDRPGQTPQGCIVNISSMAAQRALTRGIGYGAAKAAIDNFTRWLAVELSRKYGEGLRVNAIAPGFFLGEQNRSILVEPDGSPTPRGRKVLDLTPAGRFGEPEELVSALIWLCGPGASFVTGVVVPVDGGFSSFSGV